MEIVEKKIDKYINEANTLFESDPKLYSDKVMNKGLIAIHTATVGNIRRSFKVSKVILKTYDEMEREISKATKLINEIELLFKEVDEFLEYICIPTWREDIELKHLIYYENLEDTIISKGKLLKQEIDEIQSNKIRANTI